MSRRFRRPLLFSVLLTVVAGTLLVSVPAFSYLPDFTTPGPQMDRWGVLPVTWTLSPTSFSNVGMDPNTVAGILQASFSTWTSAPNAVLSVTRGQDTQVTTENTSNPPTINMICACTDVTDFTKDASTLAVTITTSSNSTSETNPQAGSAPTFVGQIIKADIIFNSKPSTPWSLSSGGNFQVVATHEIGHFFGLDHSAVVRAVMFPAASSNVTLAYDDVAGISVLYPKSPADVATGAMSGSVAFTNGNPVFGAHVYAESTTANEPFPSNIRKSPIGTLTRPDGSYTIQGLPADSYIVTAEPLDGPVSNSDVSGYPKAFGQTAVQANFTTRWH